MLNYSKMMKFFCSLFVLLTLFVFNLPDISEAARMGGGRSLGRSGGGSAYKPPPAPPSYRQQGRTSGMEKSRPAQPAPTRQTPGTAAPTAPTPPLAGKGGGFLGGLLAGSLIGSLFAGGGGAAAGATTGGGIGLLDIIIIGGLIFLLFRFFRSRQAGRSTAESGIDIGSPYIPPRTGGIDLQKNTNKAQGSFPLGSGTNTYSSESPTYTKEQAQTGSFENFDEKNFLEGAKILYARLQNSWDRRDFNDIAQFATKEILDGLQEQAKEEPPGKTEVILIKPTLVGLHNEDGKQVASVLFDVLMRERQSDPHPYPIREFWHFERDASEPSSTWKLAGIESA